MGSGYFITGTDTDCGKTVITLGLMHYLQQRGASVLGMKPVASGAQLTAQGLRNQDALLIQQQASVELPYAQVNPYSFAPPIAPHLAADQAGQQIELEPLIAQFRSLERQADQVIVEGVGGWMVPLNRQHTVADLAVQLGLPVILVVGLKLGCINHALLTATAITRNGPPLAGWIANQTDPQMQESAANLSTLQQMLDAPFLGFVPYLPEVLSASVASHLSL